MSKPQVTITLGRTGQKVVKRPQATSDRARTDSQPLSRSKRYRRDGFESNADTSMLSINKRIRGNAITRSPGQNIVEDARVGRNDLRLKLTRKRISRRMHEIEERRKMELRQKMSRTFRAPERTECSLLRRIPSTKRAGGLLMMDPFRSHSSWTSTGLIHESPDRVLQTSRISHQRNIDDMWRVSSTRPIDASRTGRLLGSDVFDHSRPKGPAAFTRAATLDAHKPSGELLPANSGMPKSSYFGEQPLTVSSLLHSVGLGKYAVQFQAEEVDMTALKQMGDQDLKEMGIPMGPRKKILAILAHSKKQQL